jgi:hypothetical protein
VSVNWHTYCTVFSDVTLCRMIFTDVSTNVELPSSWSSSWSTMIRRHNPQNHPQHCCEDIKSRALTLPVLLLRFCKLVCVFCPEIQTKFI